MRPPRSFGVSRKHRKSAQSVGTRSMMRSRGAEIRQREARTARPAVGCERRVCGARRIKGGRVGIVALESTRRSSKTVCPCRRKNLREREQEVSLFCTCTSHARRTRSVSVASVCFFSVGGLSTCSRGTPSRSSRLDSRSRIFYIRAPPPLCPAPPRPLVFARALHAAAASRAALAPAIFSSIFARRSSESSNASIALT